MSCPECLELIQRRLDGEPHSPAPAFDEHLASCLGCRERNLAANRLLEALPARPRPPAPAAFTQRIVANVLRDRALRRRRLRLRLVYTSALAASVLLLLVAGYLWSPPRPDAGSTTAKQEPKELPAPMVVPEVVPDPRPRLAPRPRTASLGDRLADTTREQALVLWVAASPFGSLPLSSELEPLDPAAQSLKRAGQEVTQGVQTVTRASRQALAYFVRELPVLDVPRTLALLAYQQRRKIAAYRAHRKRRLAALARAG